MNLQTKRHNKIPVEGNRSSYIGLNLFMSQDFFNATSDMESGPKRPDPRIKIYSTKSQVELRRRLFQKAEIDGISIEEVEAEWRLRTKESTEIATKVFREEIPASKPGDPVWFTPENKKAVIKALRIGEKHAAAEVYHVEKYPNSWGIELQNEMKFENPLMLYVRDDTDGNYKIGQTRKSDARESAYKTHTMKSVLLAEYEQFGILNETNVHAFFADKRVKREFFRLTPTDLEIVTNRNLMINELRKAGF